MNKENFNDLRFSNLMSDREISMNSRENHQNINRNTNEGVSRDATPRYNSSGVYQENRGKRWTTEEDMYLLQQVNFLSYADIGRHLRRSENAVVSRLKKLAFHMIQNGEDPVVVQNNLRLSNEDIEQINNECFIYPKKNNSKFITTTKKSLKKGYFNTPQQSQEIQLLMEIRGMLRKLLQQTHDNVHSSVRNINKNTNQNALRIYDFNMEDLEKRSEEFAKMY